MGELPTKPVEGEPDTQTSAVREPTEVEDEVKVIGQKCFCDKFIKLVFFCTGGIAEDVNTNYQVDNKCSVYVLQNWRESQITPTEEDYGELDGPWIVCEQYNYHVEGPP